MSTAIGEKPQHEFIDPNTGEVLDRNGYCSYLGIDPQFRVKDLESLEWYQKERIQKQAVVDAIKAQYSRILKSAEAEVANLDFHFKEDAMRVHEEITVAAGKQTHHTSYATFQIKNFTKGSWKLGNDDSLQTWLRFLPNEDTECEMPDGSILVLPGKETLGVKPVQFTRNLDLLKHWVEERRVKELELHQLQSQGKPVPATLIKTVEALKESLPNDALEYTPPHTTKTMSWPKTGGEK